MGLEPELGVNSLHVMILGQQEPEIGRPLQGREEGQTKFYQAVWGYRWHMLPGVRKDSLSDQLGKEVGVSVRLGGVWDAGSG